MYRDTSYSHITRPGLYRDSNFLASEYRIRKPFRQRSFLLPHLVPMTAPAL